MLIMRFAATIGVLIGLAAGCLGLEVHVPNLSDDMALLGLLLGFAYVLSEAADFLRRLTTSKRKSARARRFRAPAATKPARSKARSRAPVRRRSKARPAEGPEKAT